MKRRKIGPDQNKDKREEKSKTERKKNDSQVFEMGEKYLKNQMHRILCSMKGISWYFI